MGLAVGAVLVAGILDLIEQSQKAYMHSSEVTDLQQNVRVAMDRVVRIIQAAGVNPMNKPWGGATTNDPAFTAFREAGRNCIRLYADLNGDGIVTTTAFDENVFFFWPGDGDGAALSETRGTVGGQPDARRGVGRRYRRPPTSWRATSWPTPAAPTCSSTSPGPNDARGPNTQLTPPASSTTTCASLSDREPRPGPAGGDHADGARDDRRPDRDQDPDVRCACAQRALKEEPAMPRFMARLAAPARNERGVALFAAIAGMVLLSTMIAALVILARNEDLIAQLNKDEAQAAYAAEAGANWGRQAPPAAPERGSAGRRRPPRAARP